MHRCLLKTSIICLPSFQNQHFPAVLSLLHHRTKGDLKYIPHWVLFLIRPMLIWTAHFLQFKPDGPMAQIPLALSSSKSWSQVRRAPLTFWELLTRSTLDSTFLTDTSQCWRISTYVTSSKLGESFNRLTFRREVGTITLFLFVCLFRFIYSNSNIHLREQYFVTRKPIYIFFNPIHIFASARILCSPTSLMPFLFPCKEQCHRFHHRHRQGSLCRRYSPTDSLSQTR